MAPADIKNTNRGFVLIYAVLIAGIIFVVSLLMSDILTRRVIISAFSKNYQYAYYIANAGRECARKLDYENKTFGRVSSDLDGKLSLTEPSPHPTIGNSANQHNIVCNPSGSISDPTFKVSLVTEGAALYEYDTNAGINAVTRFMLNKSDDHTCAIVTVKIGLDQFGKDSQITSKGFNMDCFSTNERKVEAVTISTNL